MRKKISASAISIAVIIDTENEIVKNSLTRELAKQVSQKFNVPVESVFIQETVQTSSELSSRIVRELRPEKMVLYYQIRGCMVSLYQKHIVSAESAEEIFAEREKREPYKVKRHLGINLKNYCADTCSVENLSTLEALQPQDTLAVA